MAIYTLAVIAEVRTGKQKRGKNNYDEQVMRRFHWSPGEMSICILPHSQSGKTKKAPEESRALSFMLTSYIGQTLFIRRLGATGAGRAFVGRCTGCLLAVTLIIPTATF